jgi:RNA polymerase-associated protein RTF1
VVESSSEDDDDDDDSSEEEFELDMETFDNNKLIKDEADRKMLDKMPELEREAILAERFEKLKADADMKKAMRDVK